MKKQRSLQIPEIFSHDQYRSAGVAHLLNYDHELEFYYRGKPITKEKADEMVIEHFKKRRNTHSNRKIGQLK